MARKVRRSNSRSTEHTEFYIILFGGFIILSILFFIMSRGNAGVKSAKDFRQPTTATKSGEACTPGRVKAFSVENHCENGQKDGFSIARYTCADGTQGVLDKGCMNPGQAFAYAKLACAKSTCPNIKASARPIKVEKTDKTAR